MPQFNLRKPSFKTKRKAHRKRIVRQVAVFTDMIPIFQQLTPVDQARIARTVDRDMKHIESESNAYTGLPPIMELRSTKRLIAAYEYAKEFVKTIAV